MSDLDEVVIRPIQRADGPALRRFHDGLSERTVYLRFFAVHPHLTDEEVDHFTVVDHASREALVVERGDDIVAVARFDQTSPDRAEVAFVVADDCQGRGLGMRLLDELVPRAQARGIAALDADVLTSNARMLGLFERCGWPMSEQHVDDVVRVTLDITSGARSGDRAAAVGDVGADGQDGNPGR